MLSGSDELNDATALRVKACFQPAGCLKRITSIHHSDSPDNTLIVNLLQGWSQRRRINRDRNDAVHYVEQDSNASICIHPIEVTD